METSVHGIRLASDVPYGEELLPLDVINVADGEIRVNVILREDVAVPVKINSELDDGEVEMKTLTLRNYDVNGTGGKLLARHCVQSQKIRYTSFSTTSYQCRS